MSLKEIAELFNTAYQTQLLYMWVYPISGVKNTLMTLGVGTFSKLIRVMHMVTKSNEKSERLELAPVKGTREYLPAEQLVREKIADILKTNFRLFGYGPIETTILEYFEIGASKYSGGAEILKETYKLSDQGGRALILRYELTFKLGKLVGMNPDIRLPLKRYEIGKVFRDGPVKAGRLREFTQCDVDVVGVKNLAADAELLKMAFGIFNELGIKVNVQINNRKLLFGVFEAAGIPQDKFMYAALSFDKLDKFGEKSVREELSSKDIPAAAIDKLFDIINGATQKLNNKEKLEYFSTKLQNETARAGIVELQQIFQNCESFEVTGDLRLTPTLARGLVYYTGPMWEVYQSDAMQSKISGSLAAGGRWDNMIQQFLGSKEEYPATGMTFGLDVIYAVLEEKGIGAFITNRQRVPTVLIIPINTLQQSIGIASKLRDGGISVDIAFDKKVGKAMEYADKQKIPYVAVIGEREVKENKVNLKEMESGKEEVVEMAQIVERMRDLLR